MSLAKETLLFLAHFNSWRRGNDVTLSFDPTEVGAAIDHAVYLLRRYDDMERENVDLKQRANELELKLTALGNIAIADWDNSTVGEVDKVVNSHKTTYNDQLRTLFTTNPEKIKKLEQENAELRTALNTALAVEFIDDTTIVELVERLIKIKKEHATTAR